MNSEQTRAPRPTRRTLGRVDNGVMAPRSSPPRVFLSDDSAPIRDRLASMLRARSMDIVGEAGTPQASIEGILASAPDVVIQDIALEGGSGLDVIRGIRPLLPGTAFIVLSNSSAPAYRERYLAEGVVGFLDKSTEFDQLASVIEGAAARSRS